MEKIKSVLYNISSSSPHLPAFYEEYDNLVKHIIDGAKDFEYSCSIHIDYGTYELLKYNMLRHTFYPNIHVVVTAIDTTEAEQLIDKAITQNRFYDGFNKYCAGENEANLSYVKTLDELGFKQDIIEVTCSKTQKRILIGSQTSYDI